MYVITGASRGIGEYLFQRFRSEGEEVAGICSSMPSSQAQAAGLHQVDVSDGGAVAAWAAQMEGHLNRVVLINCAAINYNSFAHKADLARWEQVIKVNLIGTFNMIHAVLPRMRAEGFGRVINFSSVVAQMPIAGTSAYAASKAALFGLGRALAAENASKGITINSLNLGYFDIGVIRDVPAEMQNAIKVRIPAGAFGQPDQIYQAIKFIVSEGYLNGAGLDINGGLT